MVTRVELVADTFTNITTQVAALGNYTKVLTALTDVSLGIVKAAGTPTGLQAVTGGGKAVILFNPEGSTDTVWAYSTAGGAIYLHSNGGVEYIQKDVGSLTAPTMGTGWSSGGTAWVKESIVRNGDIIHTTLFLDIIGLDSSAGTTDIIGEIGAANSWFYQVTTAKNGVIQSGSLECLVTPATGDVDIDLYSADEATGVEDAAVTGLTDDRLLANGASMALGDGPDALALVPGANQYLYLTGAGSTNATYTAGRFKIEMWGLGA